MTGATSLRLDADRQTDARPQADADEPAGTTPTTGRQTGAHDAPMLQLVDATPGSGLSFRSRYGTADKLWPTEFGGSGAGWIDYDLDGRIDVLLINALDGPGDDPEGAVARRARSAVLRDPGDGPTATGQTATTSSQTPAIELGHRLFRNRGHARFEELRGTGIEDIAWGNGVAVGDVDNDGFPDLYVTAIGPNRLYRNNGDGSFSGLEAGIEDARWSTSAAFLDWNDDGFLDLYVANYVDFDPATTAKQGDGVCNYRGIDVFCGPEGLRGAADGLFLNRGDGTFEEVTDPPIDPDLTYGFALVASDCDGDLLPEIFVAADSTMNLLYGRRDGALDDRSLFSGAGYSGAGREQAGMGATAGDFDGDGDMDLYVTNFTNDYNTLYRNLGNCLFADVSEALGLGHSSLPFMGWAPLFVDIDGDADLDLFVANGHIYPQLDDAGLEPYVQRNLLYRNALYEAPGDAPAERARFVEIGADAGPGMALQRASRGVAAGDFDDDYDTDLLITNIDASPDLLRNDGAPAHPGLRITLLPRGGNRSGHGARVTVVSGGITQVRELRGSDGYLGSNDPRLLVHLPGGRADQVVIAWPGGATLTLRDVAPGWIVVDETRGVVATRTVP